jgi:ABC-type amino acid transport substrate-binding protein
LKATVLCLLLIVPNWLFAKPVMHVSSINQEANSTLVKGVQQAYAQLGLDTSITQMPALRAIRQAEQDQEFDAVLARDASTQVLLPHYLQLDVPIQQGQIVAYSKQHGIVIKNWQSLRNYRLAIVRGILTVSQPLSFHRKLEVVNTPHQAMLMLQRDRVDLAILPNNFAQRELDHHHYPQIKQVAVLKEYSLYHYLHEKHAELVPALNRALAQSFNQLNLPKGQLTNSQTIN